MASYFSELFHAWLNVHWFLYHFFSLNVLSNTFFAPFHRIEERTSRGFHPQEFLEVLIINIVTRLVGVVIRSIFIVFGLVAQVLAFMLGAGFVLAAITSPVLVPASILYGFWLAIF